VTDILHYVGLFESWLGSIALDLQGLFSDGTEGNRLSGKSRRQRREAGKFDTPKVA
jgi:hypothetical protein